MSTMLAVRRLMNSVEGVLGEKRALAAFIDWAKQDESRCSAAILLSIAVSRYAELERAKDTNAPAFAVVTHKNYISLKTGSCTFLPQCSREEMSKRAHAVKNGPPPGADFFEPVMDALDKWLRALHAKFVCSKQFYALVKDMQENDEAQLPSTSTGEGISVISPPVNGTLLRSTRKDGKDRSHSSSTHSSASPASKAFSPSTSATVPACPTVPPHALPDSTTVLQSESKPPKSSFTIAALSSSTMTTLSPSFNPFRTYNAVKVEPIDPLIVTMAPKHHLEEGRETFAGSLNDRLECLVEQMSQRGVQFARDLLMDPAPELKAERDDDTDDSIERDIDDYAHRLDASANKRSASRSPPSLPTSAPVSAPPQLFTNSFAPPPTNRLRRKLQESSMAFVPTQTSPTSSGSISKKGRSSLYHDSSSSGFYSGSSVFSSHFSSSSPQEPPHFSTLRRPSMHAERNRSMTHSGGSGVAGGTGAECFATLTRAVHHHRMHTVDADPSSFSAFNAGMSFGVSPPTSLNASPSHLPSGFLTLPRPIARPRPHASAVASTSSAPSDGTILLRVVLHGGRPMVFRTEPPEGGMTLAQFRTIFGIGKEKNKFFFKNECTEEEDDREATAPIDYQWELVSDDKQIVPLYRGAISAECRPALPSPE